MPAYADAHVMRNCKITVETTEYANQVSKARLVPDTPVQTQRTLVPDGVVQDVDSTVWTLELSGLQSTKAGGLAKLFNESVGQQLEVVIQPKLGTGEDTATCTIIAMPVEFGGEQGAFRTFEAEFPVIGQPVFGTATV